MKRFWQSALGMVIPLFLISECAAITITNDTVIHSFDTNYDGADIVVSNCTVAVNGSHAFSNLLVTAGGTLTHSSATGGVINVSRSFENEPQTLIGTDPVTLMHSGVITSILVTDLSLTNVYTTNQDYEVLFPGGQVIQLQRTTNSAIPDGATVLVTYTVTVSTPAGLAVTVTGNAEVEAGGKINLVGLGFGGNVGSGRGGTSVATPASGGGGGYGGYGGASSSNAMGGNVYGLFNQPASLGSGGGLGVNGGVGGAGGGLVRLNVGGNFILNGQIAAEGVNATNSRSGGGAGGAVWISAQTISGAGSISANGGAGEPIHGGGGGGGRIAIYFDTNSFTGTILAHGGAGFVGGGAGTIYLKKNSVSSGLLVLDNGGLAGTNTLIQVSSPTALTITGRAIAIPSGLQVLQSLLISSNSSLQAPPTLGATLLVISNATIEAGATMMADNRGFAGGAGPGAGMTAGSPNNYGTGAGHGGFGAASVLNLGSSGGTYDSLVGPTAAGSGGGNANSISGGSGGGIISLSVSGILTVNGKISANGGNGNPPRTGGGSGGSIWLTVGTFAGNGTVSANGGAGDLGGGGGGGGRIVVEHQTNLYTGTVTAFGGGGTNWGGAGTIYTIQTPNSPTVFGSIVLDNNDRVGAGTSLGTTSTWKSDLAIRRGAFLFWPSGGSFGLRNLTVGSNSFLSFTNGVLTMVMTNATIDDGGKIIVDGGGFASGLGTGFGASSGGIGGGASYGGMGGRHPNLIGSGGGSVYGSVTQPIDRGSGGGGPGGVNAGGAGGGSVTLSVMNAFQINGRLSANGLNGAGTNTGGGSGGSFWISAETISGSGSITANGGNGPLVFGGGGGGGRIALYYATNTFSGVLSAFGGSGPARGGAGTIYSKQTVRNGLVQIDNGGVGGTNTPILSNVSGTVDLTVKDGAVVNLSIPFAISNLTVTGDSRLTFPTAFAGSLTWANLLLSSNSWVSGGNWNLTVTGNVSIGPDCGLVADAVVTSPQANGAGFGGTYAGYGGFSSNSTSGPSTPYGSITQPFSSGTAGRPLFIPNLGLAGGVLRLTAGTLALDGRISADGTNGFSLGSSGGGSGGSVWLTVGTLTGSGLISASGGPGLNGGGGGGGGRVAVYVTTNLFTGNMAAFGGTGFCVGGAGTIYTRFGQQSSGTIIVDNGGRIGTNTVVNFSSTDDWVVSRQARATWNTTVNMRQLIVRSNGWLIPTSASITVSSNATIESGSGILADGLGSGPASGSGGGSSTTKGGGSHGGFGGSNPIIGGFAYGLITAPGSSGSGGGNGVLTSPMTFGGSGGGIVRMIVSGNLTLDGDISADGMPGGFNSGGGSGGSIRLTLAGLSGAGTISADGGSGNGLGGGGGGGRISIDYGSNSFSGSISAFGGIGSVGGGAGTIYLKGSSQTVGTIVVNNGGRSGTNTPLSSSFSMPLPPFAFDLTVEGGAIVHFPDSFPLLSNLVVSSSSQITATPSQANLELAVLRDLTVTEGGAITVDGKGFAMQNGPGAGTYSSSDGSGGGYGGIGGLSGSGVPGGVTYGSVTEPVDRGSGGGQGTGPSFGGSAGGGAIRLTVGGTATVDGFLEANGQSGLQDNSGGGSGGSIWLTANTLVGGGAITADGGLGEFYNGGGGGGGRIAIYSPMNVFTGAVNAVGGPGASAGLSGTVFTSTNPPGFQVVSQFPTAVVSNTVSLIQFTFNQPVDVNSVTASDFTVITPNGPLPTASLSVGYSGLSKVNVTFPAQNLLGNYRIEAGPNIQDLLGQPMSQVYTGAFTVVLPTISGTVTDTNGSPVSGVLLQPSDGLTGVTTDTNGNYVLGIPPNWSGIVTPSLGSFLFAPGMRLYPIVTNSPTGQDYLMVETIAPTLSSGIQDTNIVINWVGLQGVSYQPYSSTNLIDWEPYNGLAVGTNGPIQIAVPIDSDPARFFRILAAYDVAEH